MFRPRVPIPNERIAMYLFTLTATPDADNEEFKAFECADVSAWIDFKEPAGAEELARFYIRESGWSPGDTLAYYEIVVDALDDDDESLEFVREAAEFGHSLLIEAWEEEDENESEE